VKRPEPGPDEILVDIDAAGVNFIDVYHRTGQYEMRPRRRTATSRRGRRRGSCS
jgi:NADPH:quinone reductase-like Zn-dependent oxidoreductase